MLRGNTAEVTGASASWIEARVREIAGGEELLDVSRGKGKKGGARFGFYRPDGHGVEGRGSGARRFPAVRARAACLVGASARRISIRACAIGGGEKGRNTGKKGKGRRQARR